MAICNDGFPNWCEYLRVCKMRDISLARHHFAMLVRQLQRNMMNQSLLTICREGDMICIVNVINAIND
jgi:hypothetical protein